MRSVRSSPQAYTLDPFRYELVDIPFKCSNHRCGGEKNCEIDSIPRPSVAGWKTSGRRQIDEAVGPGSRGTRWPPASRCGRLYCIERPGQRQNRGTGQDSSRTRPTAFAAEKLPRAGADMTRIRARRPDRDSLRNRSRAGALGGDSIAFATICARSGGPARRA